MSFSWFKNVSARQKNGLILLLIGFFCFLVAFSIRGYQNLQQNILSFSQAPIINELVEEEDMPEKILIPSVKIELPVLPAKVIDNHWETAAEGASYLLGSGIPGKEGNVIIYGHNKNHLFGPIRWLKGNEEIKIVNKKEEEFVYQITEIKTVSPENVEVLASTDDAILTLYTCTGFLDQERFVVVAKLQLE